MSLSKLAQLLEHEPGYATKLPGYHTLSRTKVEALETVPSPKERAILAGAADAVRLHQLAQRLGGTPVAKTLARAADKLYKKSGASKVPAPALHRMLLIHWPPIPLSHTVRLVEILAMQYVVALATSDAAKYRPPLANSKTIADLMKELIGWGSDGAGGGGVGGGGKILTLILKPVPPPRGGGSLR